MTGGSKRFSKIRRLGAVAARVSERLLEETAVREFIEILGEAVSRVHRRSDGQSSGSDEYLSLHSSGLALIPEVLVLVVRGNLRSDRFVLVSFEYQ